MQPKNAPKTPISHLQRRRRFQLRLDQHPQRRQRFQLRLDQHPQRQCRFQSRLGRRPQRRWRFQTTGPPGRQSLTTAPVGSIGAWPGDQWAADVTNVVKPTRFTSPREDPCYKRRQSEPKNRHFQRKIPRIDDVCNNRHPSTPKTQHARPPHDAHRKRRGLAGQRANAPSHTSVHQAPLVWRAPEGPEGTGGLRGAAPNEVRPPSLAGGRALRRPEHQRGHTRHHAAHHANGWGASRHPTRQHQ